MKRILLSVPHMGGNELRYVQEAFESNWLSTVGPNIDAFEAEFSRRIGLPSVALGSGTAAIHLALRLFGVGPGDEVVAPTLTFAASVNPIVYQGGTPIFLDSDRTSWNLDPQLLADFLAARAQRNRLPKAVVVVHLFGQCVDMDPILEVCARYDVRVLEDAAEAHGAEYKGRRTGGLGHAAGFSLYGNKIITTGEGGMVTTNDRELARLAWNLRDHAFSHERHFWHKFVGFNYRMTNLQAAVGLAQVEQLDGFVAARRRNALEYNCRLHGVPGIRTPAEAPWAKNVYWMYGILVNEKEYGMNRDALRRVLADHGVETRTFFIPMHAQPIYWKQFYGERYPVAEDLCKRGFYLPSASSLTIEEIEYVTDVIRRAAR